MIKKIYNHFNQKNVFDSIVRANDLKIDYSSNRPSLALIKSIFVDREYADYFPFYKKAIIVDIGAHKGYFTLFASLNSDKQSTIISIEPVESNYKLLEQNILRQGVENVQVMKAAIAHFDGQLDIHLSQDTNHSLIKNNPLSGETNAIEKVKAITLDSLVSQFQLGEIDFLKMDCEGAEYDILFNVSDETLKKIKILSMEFHDLKSPVNNAQALISYLENKQFRVVKFQYEPSNLGLNYGKLIFQKINP
ncbi:MAG: FkbM family methyltransferase [Flavobacteriales bacterium]|jgi:FkbM family methyltransferase